MYIYGYFLFNTSISYDNTDNINGNSLVAVDKLARNRSILEKCPNCQELEEALRKTTTLSTAFTLNSLANEESEIEISYPYLEVQQYMATEFKKGKSKVWFSAKVNVKTKKVISAKTGRILVDIN